MNQENIELIVDYLGEIECSLENLTDSIYQIRNCLLGELGEK